MSRRNGRRNRTRLAVALTGLAVATCAATMSTAQAADDPSLGYDPATDMGSLSAISRITGAQSMWARGYTGRGVDVAVIDTGVARVPGLDHEGKVIDGADLSFDSQDPYLVYTDAYGHGTHMAGIIAGSDVPMGAKGNCRTCLVKSPYSDTTKFVGIAPESRIVSVKVGAFDGAVDVSQVIAAIDWVVQHRNDALPAGAPLNIKVISLSFGTDSLQPADVDPLVHAVEVAWKAGILVVVAGGNDGRNAGPLGNPAMSPVVLAVGASDPRGTLVVTDDRIPRFAEHGTEARTVDVVAPGVSVISLAVPGSFVDENVSTGKVGKRFQRGSGTSQSTAVVAGLGALLWSQYPSATPGQIKALLQQHALALHVSSNKWYAGSGSAYVGGVSAGTSLPAAAPPTSWGTGLGSLELARGTYHLTSNGVVLEGEQDIFGMPWVATTMAPLTEQRATWDGGWWNGSQWTWDRFVEVDADLLAWDSVKWAGARWSSVKWAGARWTGTDWSGARWSDLTWDGARWTGARWTDMTWDGARWSGARWSGARWSSGIWEGARWSGARWSDDGWS